jgi:c-di-GMP-binding flagellar brake protein YcgR
MIKRTAHIINISYGGVGIYVKESLKGWVQITIKLRVSGDKWVAETVCGHVAWKKRIGSMYAIGISFIDLDPKDHRHIVSFLRQATK